MFDKSVFYVDWANTRIISVTIEQFNKIINNLHRLGYKKRELKNNHKTITSLFVMDQAYFVQRGKSYAMIHVWISNNKKKKAYGIRFRCGGVSKVPTPGRTGYIRIDNMFKSIAKKNSIEYFSGYENRYIADMIKLCVPAPVNWNDQTCKRDIVNHVYKLDISSAYPYEATKMLPTLHGHLYVDKEEVEPTPEYPFAFYPHLNALKILGELDTREYFNRPEYKYSSPEHACGKCTILCKGLKDHPLQRIFQNVYDGRDAIEGSKFWMNAYIGYCHRNDYPILAEIPAVVIARCIKRMLDLEDELIRRKQRVLLINTDSILWQGKEQTDLVSENKYLGAAYMDQEWKDIEAQICSPKKYQLKYKSGLVDTKWAGDHKDIDVSKFYFGQLLMTEEAEKSYFYDENSGQIMEKYPTEYGKIVSKVL